MTHRNWFSWLWILPLAFLVACSGGSDSWDSARIDVQANYQKRVLGPNGFSGVTTPAARYCYVELRDDRSDGVYDSFFLDGNGQGHGYVPAGTNVYAVVWAKYEVPSASGSFFMRGSVVKGVAADSYADIDDFNRTSNWYMTSDTAYVDRDSSVSLTAQESTREAGAFAITDQAVTFAQAIQNLEPSLRLPNLHSFWAAGYTDDTTYPTVAVDRNNHILTQVSGRAVFQHEVRYNPTGALSQGADEYNDGALQEAFAHLLFADYSYPENGSSAASIIRRDNDNIYVARMEQKESTVAFADGFCDFLSGAIRNSNFLADVSAQGQVLPFYLDSHTQFSPATGQGEFYRGSVAISLYGIWQNALGGGTSGLQTLWSATLSKASGAYLNAPLGCYPTYLMGLKNIIGTGSTWNTVLAELAKENIGDVTSASYFASEALWKTRAVPFSLTDALCTYAPSSGIYYDRNQSQAYRFTQAAAGNRVITLNPTGGQDFFLELIGPTGVYYQSLSPNSVNGMPQTRTITASNLPAGDYVVRVRAGYTTASNPAATFTLDVR